MSVEALLADYLGQQWGVPVTIANLRRFHGGAARETYRFDATTPTGTRGLVLRRDPPSSLIETERRPEFDALAAFHGTEVPVPEPLFLDETGAGLGMPGFVMAEVPGLHTGPMFNPEPYGVYAEAVGEAMFAILGAIHRRDPAAIPGLAKPAADEAWRVRLDHWRTAAEADAVGPEPILWAGFRWLERNPPPPAQAVTIVHGDYRSGNFLVDDDGRIGAVVDWEMVHLGDPLEDLAWAMDPLWAHGTDRPAGTIPEAAAIAAWERSSGLVADRVALRWWRVFAQVMGLSIWVSSAREVADGRSIDPVMVFSSLYPYRLHNHRLALTLRGLAA